MRFLALLGMTRVVCGVSIGMLIVAMVWICLPKPPLLDGMSFSREVFDRNHTLLRVTLTDDQKFRIYTPLDEISPELIHATLLQEDRFFLSHFGVNPVAAARSVFNFCLHGHAHAGASTITMQLARMRFHIHSRTVRGKLTQMIRALELERHYTKSQILEAYFNLVPYGGNLEGIGAASEMYFGKAPSKLTQPEAVALSVIPQSPARRTLLRGRENAALTSAQNRLSMRVGGASGGESFRAQADVQRRFLAPHFIAEVLEQNACHPERSEAKLNEVEGSRETSGGVDRESVVVSRGSSTTLRSAWNDSRLKISTTLDLDLQRILERCIESYIAANRRLGITNAAAMLVDSRTMDVLAEVGSANFLTKKSADKSMARVANARRDRR